MASVNPHTRELVFKLVFYGPGLGGKTTTLQYVHTATKAEHRGKMVSLATPTDRTLYFDYLPIRVPRVRGMAVRLQLFTVPGQVYYAATRKLVLSGADGIVFVADSQAARLDTNQEALDDLRANLTEHNRKLEEVPHTFHWNKRDLDDLVSIEDLEKRFNVHRAPSLGTVATRGEGVFEGLEQITRLLLKGYENDPKLRIELTGTNTLVSGGDGRGKLSADAIVSELRQLEERPRPSNVTAGSGGPSSPKDSSLKESREHVSAPSAASGAGASGTSMRGRAPSFSTIDAEWGAASAEQAPEAVAAPFSPPSQAAQASPAPQASLSQPSLSQASQSPRSMASGPAFSLAELWPTAERESVKQAESMIAANDAVNAVLACDVLVTRVLASAAGLVGTLDAPRDPAVVSLLLGLDGTRYLQFRTAVRAARHREGVTMKDALESFTFALEARRARDLLRR